MPSLGHVQTDNPSTGTLAVLFAQFIQHGRFLRNWSPKTVRSYEQAFASLSRPLATTELPTKGQLEGWVVSMRGRGVSAGACNVYIRSMNSFLSWLAAESEIPAPLRLKLLKAESRTIETFNEAHVRAILAWRPNTFGEHRLHALIQTLFDTGCRIEELLTASESDVDFDNMLLTVIGKGSKQRKIPFSLELRKTLFRFVQLKRKRGIRPEILFCTHLGGRLAYYNIYRDIRVLCEHLGIEGPRISPHTFRHSFATNFLRQGGDIYKLARVLGHSDIRTTMRYLHLNPEDLRAHQEKTSLLRRTR